MGFTNSFYTDWGLLSTAAAVLSVLISILLIQAGRIFNLPNFEQMAKAELSYAATTFLIVIMIITIIQFGEGALAGGVSLPGATTSTPNCRDKFWPIPSLTPVLQDCIIT